MRTFHLEREVDVSGVSGTGRIAEGVEFTNRKCALSWRTKYTSIVIYDDIETLIAIHGHDGKTVVVWHSGEFDGAP